MPASLLRFGEGAVVGEEHAEVVVGVVAQPRAHTGSGVEALVLPGPPQRVEADDSLWVAPTVGCPMELAAIAEAKCSASVAAFTSSVT